MNWCALLVLLTFFKNTILTIPQLFFICVLEQDIQSKYAMAIPQVYEETQRTGNLSIGDIIEWYCYSLGHSFIPSSKTTQFSSMKRGLLSITRCSLKSLGGICCLCLQLSCCSVFVRLLGFMCCCMSFALLYISSLSWCIRVLIRITLESFVFCSLFLVCGSRFHALLVQLLRLI